MKTSRELSFKLPLFSAYFLLAWISGGVEETQIRWIPHCPALASKLLVEDLRCYPLVINQIEKERLFCFAKTREGEGIPFRLFFSFRWRINRLT